MAYHYTTVSRASLLSTPLSLRTSIIGSRGFATGGDWSTGSKQFSISEGDDAETVTRDAFALIGGGRWRICNAGKGVERQFEFKTFRRTWDFMNHVAAECRKQKHHPEWTNIYNRTHIRWTTHSPEGLSSRDTYMARFCDEAAEHFGELTQDAGKEISDDSRLQAGNCCGERNTGGR